MPARRQTMPQITLRYATDEVTQQPTWTLLISDGEHTAEPVKVTPETAAGIAQIVDVALPLPIDLAGEATSAERLVRLAHVQTLEAQLAAAQAGLKATGFAPPTVAPAPESDTAPGARPGRARRTTGATKGRGKAGEATVTALPTVADTLAGATDTARDDSFPHVPALETVPDGAVALPDEPPMVDEPPHFDELPEHLPRTSHLVVPEIDEF